MLLGVPNVHGSISRFEGRASVFAAAIDYDAVRVHRRKWFPLHPRRAVMAPDGHLWVHPKSKLWSDDYAAAPLGLQGLFVHEMTHVWQAQTKGRWYLPVMRHPFCRYRYELVQGRPIRRYGIEPQAEIVRHVFDLRRGRRPDGAPPLNRIGPLLPFQGPDSIRVGRDRGQTPPSSSRRRPGSTLWVDGGATPRFASNAEFTGPGFRRDDSEITVEIEIAY